MAREQQKDLAQKFIDAQGKWDFDGMTSTLADDAKHDLLPASLGVPSKDNAGKVEVTKKLASALGNKTVNVSQTPTRVRDVINRACACADPNTDQDPADDPGRRATQGRLLH